jgi:4-hydroxy-tetrahydrodipicolinate synthase
MLFGLASEFYKLTDAESELLMQILLGETSRHPRVAGVISITHHSWEVAVTRAREAETLGR